jgi:PAS domain S-box-containing protein
MIMETRDRSSSTESPHHGHGHPGDWITKPYSIVYTAVVVFILIFGIAIFHGWRQFETIRHNALTADKTTANLLADLIPAQNNATIGILGSSQRLGFLVGAIQKAPFSPYTTVNVIDRTGHILYSSKFPYSENITNYRFSPIIEAALKGKIQQIEVNDPQKDQEKSYLTVIPVRDIGWTVIIERSMRDIYRSGLRHFIEIGAASFLLFLLISVFLVYLRKVSMVRKTEELLHAEEALRREKYFAKSIIQTAQTIVLVLDTSGYIVSFNHYMEEISGYRLEEVQGKDWFSTFLPERDRNRTRKLFLNAIDDIQTCGNINSIVTKDGRERIIEWYDKTIKDEKGKSSGLLAIGQDITERKQTEEDLKSSAEQLRALAVRLQKIREEERIMIAREIHDEMGGGLTGLKMDLSWLLSKIGDPDPWKERVALMDKIRTSNALIDQLIHVVRRISTDLRPSVLDDLGLIAALEWQLSEFTSRTEIPHEFATTFKYVNMEEDTAVAVFRIFQEALTNVLRHSRATKVTVVLRKGERNLFGDENFVLEIRDNGRGITEEEILNPESLGLLGMKERVLTFRGEISIHGEPGGGTALVLKIPRIQEEPS